MDIENKKKIIMIIWKKSSMGMAMRLIHSAPIYMTGMRHLAWSSRIANYNYGKMACSYGGI